MNRADIIRMAKESGMYRILDQHASEYGNGMFEDTPYPELERFAELIAAAEREACLNQIEIIIEAEREACATIIERAGLPSIAQAIRARGKE
jgi:hypothetical protein